MKLFEFVLGERVSRPSLMAVFLFMVMADKCDMSHDAGESFKPGKYGLCHNDCQWL